MSRQFNEKSIVHMFLPKRTPEELEDDLADIEQDMLMDVADSFGEMVDNANFIQLTPVKVMLDKWVDVQPVYEPQVVELKSELEDLEVGDTIPVYVRHQNCTMMISKICIEGEEQVRVQTFRASLPSETIMSNVDPMKMKFPETSNLIENEDMLTSNIFASHVCEMALEEIDASKEELEDDDNRSSVKDVPRPFLVSDWAVGILVPRDDPTSLSITKKIRDQVTFVHGSEELIPFRRSGMWMSIKVAFQLKLLEVFGGDVVTAKMVYKIAMLRILVDACKKYRVLRANFDLDLACQMVAKVGRRVMKLQNLSCGENEAVGLMKSTVLEYTLEVLTAVNETIQNLWNRMSQPSGPTNSQPIYRSNEDFKKDFVHQIDTLDEIVISARQLLLEPVLPEIEIPDTETSKENSRNSLNRLRRRRFNTMESILDHYLDTRDPVQSQIWVHDTERYIKNIEDYGGASETIFNMGLQYIRNAKKVYKENPVGLSQILLVSLKLTYVLDTIAMRKRPLIIGQFKPDIKSSLFDCLLLPHEDDVNTLNVLLDYFNTRDKKGSRPILESEVDHSTLSVVCAEQVPDMLKLRTRILNDIEKAKKSKLEELERVREECVELQNRIKAIQGPCTCQYTRSKHGKNKRKKIHKCKRCDLKNLLLRKRKSVSVYEVPLPDAPHLQNAVIFEYLIPNEISHLRQFLAILKYELLGEPIFNGNGTHDPSKKQKHYWLGYDQLAIYKPKTTKVTNIALRSTVKPTLVKTPDLLLKTNENFIVNNEMNCHLFYRGAVDNLRVKCTFSLNKTANVPYHSLQKYLSSTEHSQNDVLTNQNNCHQQLSLNEYITFGSLRAGHRIQLRNLYMAISNRSLALDKEPVLALILQTIWQVGPRDENGIREAHLDFHVYEFASEFLEMLEKLVKANEAKYSTPLFLLSAIFITARIMEVNENCRDKCHQLFKEWRGLTQTWCTKIEEELRTDNVAIDDSKRARMYSVLHEIKMCSMMTYLNFSSCHFNNVCKDDEDVRHLLHTISSENLLARESNPSFSGFLNTLRFLQKLIPVKVDIFAHINTRRGLRMGLTKFMTEKSARPAGRYNQRNPKKMTSDENIIVLAYSDEHYDAFDFITGEFLINGYPEMELSSQINQNTAFQRFFQKYLNFRVKRKSNCVLQTCDTFHGKHYEFRTKEGLDIIEIQEDQSRFVMVPLEKLGGLVNGHFIDNFTHWLDPSTETIWFRRIAADDSDYDLPYEYHLTRHQVSSHQGWLFMDATNQRFLMSINSLGFQYITQALARLELAKYIHVFMNSSSESSPSMTGFGAHLPRHNLRFILKPDGLLESLEYPGYQVSLNQDFTGTFVGLKNGLLLENGLKRKIIVPHGRIKADLNASNLSNDNHHCCVIDLEFLSQPSFYIYEFDEVLKRIVAKKSISSWLYLAALHAVTSSSQPDPFTGITGTEMAVSILQSALVWSCSPYDKESLEILKFIKGLAPKRNYYGHKIHYRRNCKTGTGKAEPDQEDPEEAIETVEWPGGIPTMAAYDGFVFLVTKLIRDSVRLKNLHPPIGEDCLSLYNELIKYKFSEKLLTRAYLRHVSSYNDQAKLKDGVPKFKKNECQLILREELDEYKLDPMVTTSYICHICDGDNDNDSAGKFVTMGKTALTRFLFTRAPLFSDTNDKVEITLKNLFNLEFRSLWLKLYSMAISENVDTLEFNVLLSALAYRGAPPEQINILLLIRSQAKMNFEKFPPVPDLPIEVLNDPTHVYYKSQEIAEILKEHADPYKNPDSEATSDSEDSSDSMGSRDSEGSSDSDSDEERLPTAEEIDHNAKVDSNCRKIAQRWKRFWPCSEITRDGWRVLKDPDMDSSVNIKVTALAEVNAKLLQWLCARELKSFLDEVQKILTAETSMEQDHQCNFPVLQTVQTNVESQASEIRAIKLNDLMDQNEINLNLVEEATQIFQTGTIDVSQGCIRESKLACEQKIEEIKRAILENILKPTSQQILHQAGLTPRMNPVNLLEFLEVVFPDHDEYFLQYYVGALAVLWTNLKRFNRCLHFQIHEQQADLERELQNPGHENWSPMDYPEWILIELELDIMIRKVQIDVAQQMRKMPNKKNGIMQLNMGEGKTSVIVPMLCSILGAEDALCRVTVLNSLFKMNCGILQFAIGGLLNRRLYTFPCRRDLKLDETCVNDIQTIYKECMEMKGVVLTLPEYRLSFRLLAYDNILKERTAVGLKLLQTEDWLRWHVRDILDESDELLSVKYQLVYTVGEQIQVDGGEVRWLVCQQILEFVQDIVPKLVEAHGLTWIECNLENKSQSPHEFAPVRLLVSAENDEFLTSFEKLIVEKFLAGVMLPTGQTKLVFDFLVKKELDLEAYKNVMSLLQKDSVLLNKLLTLAGYLRQEILSMALMKRWRVEYGVDQTGYRKMAVPFRAKDVAAERTEFGHPDLAIILTHLSYYYSGLSDSELDEVFTILCGKLGAEAIYDRWIEKIPNAMIPMTLASFHGLHLKDASQRRSLYDLIRRHKMVVDFWLSHNVFPRESKQFPAKLVMTAADLVYERQRLPITGFSGTNDSIVHLPLTIDQQDLPDLQGTNDRMEEILLQEENNGHKGLSMGVPCEDILEQMKEDNLRILIDAGALMLELSNEQVAQRWLEIDLGIEAAVYFNRENELMVKSRGGTGSHKIPDVPLELSPFQGKVECCGVFLDDQHTRGTDLNFTTTSKACVTIGSRMKREKLLQACMRMRKLGNGQAVAFYLSHEANSKVLEMTGALSTSSVLDWVKSNTKTFNDEGLLHWVLAAKNYGQRLAAEDIFHFPNWKEPMKTTNYDEEKASVLAKQCQDEEVTAMIQMYGQHSRFELMTDLIFKWFMYSKQKLIQLNGSTDLPTPVMSRFVEIFGAVWRRCQEYVPQKLWLSTSRVADEEQEKELEKETEVDEERQVQRAGNVNSAKPHLHANVVQMVVDGMRFKVINGVMRLSDIFKDTTFAGQVQPDDWAVEVYATKDFVSVIHSSNVERCKADAYLRPMEYFVSNHSTNVNGSRQILFLSPYEVNELLPKIRDNKTKCSLHMFASRQFDKQDMLLNSPRLQLPPDAELNPSREKFHVLKSGSREMAALLLASASLFFGNQSEQKSFALFLSLIAKPWTERDRELFESGMITTSGFLLPEIREEKGVVPLGFRKDPMGLVMKILSCRHLVVSDVAHVVRLLEEKTYVKLNDRENKGDEPDNSMDVDC